ncbi:MAG: nucleotidyltransferase family protein [Acidobacteriia bacterium]|nr:nucleotidyltransferase family protein [Terriglobia bacterium]
MPTMRTPELELLLACASAQDGALCAGGWFAQRVDWDRFFEEAERHSVMPLVHRALAEHPEVPAGVRERLEKHFHESTRRSLFLTAELLRLLDAFAAGDVPVLPYKGPVLAQALYGDVALRNFTDLDFLVRRADVLRAAELLERAGYSPDPRVDSARLSSHLAFACEQMFRRTAGAGLVEIQWRIAPRYFSVEFDTEWLFRTAVAASLESRQVQSLSPEALLLMLSVHGAKHEWERLGWIADIAQLLRTYPRLDWDAIFQMARGLGIERLTLLALALAQDLLGVRLAATVGQQVSADRELPLLCRTVERRLAVEARGVPEVSGHWFTLRARERWRDRLRYVMLLALTPSPRDWALLPLPRGLSPLYFALRPLRLAGRACRGIWRRT